MSLICSPHFSHYCQILFSSVWLSLMCFTVANQSFCICIIPAGDENISIVSHRQQKCVCVTSENRFHKSIARAANRWARFCVSVNKTRLHSSVFLLPSIILFSPSLVSSSGHLDDISLFLFLRLLILSVFVRLFVYCSSSSSHVWLWPPAFDLYQLSWWISFSLFVFLSAQGRSHITPDPRIKSDPFDIRLIFSPMMPTLALLKKFSLTVMYNKFPFLKEEFLYSCQLFLSVLRVLMGWKLQLLQPSK